MANKAENGDRRTGLDRQLEDALVSLARRHPSLRGGVEIGNLPPRLWEKLRLALQVEFRRATGEHDAVLVFETGGYSALADPEDIPSQLAAAQSQIHVLSARSKQLEDEKRAIITLLYSDEVFVGSHWEDFPNVDKGVWPVFCAHFSSYGADAEEIPAEQIIPLADLVDRFGRDAIGAWVCHRRGLTDLAKGNLSAKGQEALAFLTANYAD